MGCDAMLGSRGVKRLLQCRCRGWGFCLDKLRGFAQDPAGMDWMRCQCRCLRERRGLDDLHGVPIRTGHWHERRDIWQRVRGARRCRATQRDAVQCGRQLRRGADPVQYPIQRDAGHHAAGRHCVLSDGRDVRLPKMADVHAGLRRTHVCMFACMSQFAQLQLHPPLPCFHRGCATRRVTACATAGRRSTRR